jgi:4'-phosphopantetheinyl transferase
MVQDAALGSDVPVNERRIQLALPDVGVVHVWWFPFDASRTWEATARQQLSETELTRSAQLKATDRQYRFLFYRWAIRCCLAQYANAEPNEIPLGLLAGGKPFWKYAVGGVQLAFNHSHTAEFGVLAVARHGDVGIDVEQAHENLNVRAVAREALSPQEWSEFERRPSSEQTEYVLRHWTCKEAFLKGLAIGLAVSPSNVTMRMSASWQPQVAAVEGMELTNDWQLASWSPQAETVAAVAYRGEGELQVQEFSGQHCLASFIQ